MSDVHGRPCWFELATSDLEAAKKFYEPVLGWEITDSGMEGMTYWLATSGDDKVNVAGLYPNDEMGDALPVAWTIYIAVDDCDEAVTRTQDLGGAVIAPASDIPGTGRFAIIADPNGAVLGILQPEFGDEEQAVSFGMGPGAMGKACWVGLTTIDLAGSVSFYCDLFGWQPGPLIPIDDDHGDADDGSGYQLIQIDGSPFGGIVQDDTSPVAYWGVHFQVPDAAASAAAVDKAGGQVIAGPMDVPGGSQVAAIVDPQGGIFSITADPTS